MRFGCFILVTKYHMCTSSAHPRVSESVTTRVQKYSLTAISHFARRVGRSFSREDRQVALFVLNVRRCDDTRTPHLIAHGINRGRSGAFLHDAPRALLHLQREHTCVLPVSLTTVVFPRVPFRSHAPPPTSPLPSSPPPRASLPRDCPILRPRAGLPLSLSRACDSLRSR